MPSLKVNIIVMLVLIILLALPFAISGKPNWQKPRAKKIDISFQIATSYESEINGIAGATNFAEKAPPNLLNDGKATIYGSNETNDDLYLYIKLDQPESISEIDLVAFSPDGQTHLNEFSVVARNANDNWEIIKSRVMPGASFTHKVSTPAVQDHALITVFIDPEELKDKAFDTYGIAILSESEDYERNHIGYGNGVYLREMMLRSREVL